MNAMVQIRDLTTTYQTPQSEISALSGITFDVFEGEFVSIIGPSGCGKTTLLSIIAGLLPSDGGEVLIEGSAPLEARSQIGYMLQRDSLFEWRTIWQNVLLGLEIRRTRTKENEDYARQLLKTYGLSEFLDRLPSELSGGMRQRCALIRTLVTRPKLLLLDEAFSALDYQTRLAVSNDIYGIIRNERKTAIIVTHDISEAVSLSDRVVVLTKRPSVVKNIHTLRFGAEGEAAPPPLARRQHPQFRAYFDAVWRDIDVHIG